MNGSCDGSACRAALLTPAGRGAIATVRVEGPSAVARVMQFFVPASSGTSSPRNARPQPQVIPHLRSGRIVFGQWRSPDDQVSEELIVHAEGDRAVEIHCHGGQQSAARILDCLKSAGCESVSGWDLVRASPRDRLATEALEALSESRTARTANILLDQFHGALRRELLEITASIRQGHGVLAEGRLETLAERGRWGEHLVRPWQVVLTGAPNAGKSTLLNAMLGFQRALVHEEPGTTRDVVTELTIIDGWPIQLADTAGLRNSVDTIERQGIERAQRQVADADLVLLVLDRGQPVPHHDRVAIEEHRCLTVYTKADLWGADRPFVAPPAFVVSAVSGEGLDPLMRTLIERLVGVPPEPGIAVPFKAHHTHAIRTALLEGRQGDWDQAAQRLMQLLGGETRAEM